MFSDAQAAADAVTTFLASTTELRLTWTDGPMIVALSPDAGVSAETLHFDIKWTDGSAASIESQQTLVWQRVDGQWRVLVGHESARIAGGETTG